MKVNAITRTITVDNATVFRLFVSAVYGDAKRATGKNRTLYMAFGCLVGISDVDAVKMAKFAEFARVMLETNDETR